MSDDDGEQWVVIVPPNQPLIAQQLWAEWLSTRSGQPASADVRVDTIRADGDDLLRYRVRGETVLSIEDLAARISEDCEDARSIIDEHRSEWGGGLLSHLLVADLRRHVEGWFEVNDSLCACIEVLAAGLSSGDASVQNAVAVSFVEDASWWEPERRDFVESWPQALRDEVSRQRQIRSSEAE